MSENSRLTYVSARATGADPHDIPVTSLVFNDSMDTSNMANVLLIDSTLVDKQQFYDSANSNTFPIIYDYYSKTDDLLALFREKFPASSIQRISLAFHCIGSNFMASFMNNKPLFQEIDLAEGQTSFTENVSFLTGCINEFHVAHIDFLACNTLQYSNWKSYYALLSSQTCVVVGASNDKTGNLNYGGDWVMENTHENVRDLYFNENISNYASTLAAINISADGASNAIYLQMIGADMQYSIGSVPGSWTTIASSDWPVTITNSNITPGPTNVLRVVATEDLIISSSTGGVNGYFIAGTSYITFDGSGNTININTITNYLGLIQNGTSAAAGFGNVIVKDFITAMSGSTLNIDAGWLCQKYFGRGASGNEIINCTNNGVISGQYAGGIAGSYVGYNGGSVTFTSCTNTGLISGQGAGGIAGLSAGFTNGSATFTNCTNSGEISGSSAGGIAGAEAGISGSATFTGCTNSGLISGLGAGGIAGSFAGVNGGSATLTNCFSTGLISGQFAGGIAGAFFAYNSNELCSISYCYSTGAISGSNAGGIVGANIGYTSNASYTPNVDIENCYSLGAIATTCGGICGGTSGAPYDNNPNVTITNCYSSGTIVDANSGIVAVALGLVITITQTNVYVAAGSWTDAAANASTALTGTPTSVNVNNPGSTWTTLATNTPYILSAYNAAVYSPSSANTSSSTYTSTAGLFSPGYTYRLLYTSQANNVITAQVFASKGTTPYYNSYNSNTFTLSGSSGLITTFINSSTGVLNFTLQYPCFLEGTKILCFKNNEEVYRPVESIQKGDLVKTIYNGYMPVCMMGTTSLYNPGNDYRVANRLYKCPKENYPSLFEDLYITGCHSILVPWMTNDQWENTKAVNGHIYVTDNHFRLIACADEKAEPYNKEGFMNIYHIALDHHDVCMNYGIYANGLLVESCSIEYLIKYSNLKILGEADCPVGEDVVQVSNNATRQLVDTY
jgi:hypothetical protein